MADFEAWLVFLILVVNVVGELQRKRTLAASRGFLAAARLSCYNKDWIGLDWVSAYFRSAIFRAPFSAIDFLSTLGRVGC